MAASAIVTISVAALTGAAARTVRVSSTSLTGGCSASWSRTSIPAACRWVTCNGSRGASSGCVASLAASSKTVRRAASAGGVSGSSFPNGDTRRRATNDVNATPGAKFRAGHQKHHSAVGHLDSRPATHYKQVGAASFRSLGRIVLLRIVEDQGPIALCPLSGGTNSCIPEFVYSPASCHVPRRGSYHRALTDFPDSLPMCTLTGFPVGR